MSFNKYLTKLHTTCCLHAGAASKLLHVACYMLHVYSIGAKSAVYNNGGNNNSYWSICRVNSAYEQW